MAQKQIPVVVSEQAAARVAELGMQRQFEQMIDHARATAPGLRSIHVTLEWDYECPDRDRSVVIWVQRDERSNPEEFDPTDRDWGRWQGKQFPPEVFTHFSLVSVYGEAHGW
jgi:hypothetical protein